ncbi:MAG: glycoside hydrolase family 95 protein [Lachnospiraceae bacterium]
MMEMLIYDKPARSWTEALPLGNGRLGAMVWGEPFEGSVQMNEESVVYGGPVNRLNDDARSGLDKVRSLLREGRLKEAEQTELYAMSGVPQSQRPYQTLGEFRYLVETEEKDYQDYKRELNIEEGVLRITFRQKDVIYKITGFISFEEDMLVMKFESDKPEGISMSALMTRGRYYNTAGKADDQTIYVAGDLGKTGSDFAVFAKAVSDTGQISVVGEHLVIRESRQVVFYINGVTTFPFRKRKITNVTEHLNNQMKPYGFRHYQDIKDAHIIRHREMYRRSVLELSESLELNDLTTDQRIERMRSGKQDKGLVSLYYGYGRYLLMSSSMPGGLPANLQGIWCDGLEPTWDSKYTININTQMNYWPAEICSLSECHEPLFDLLERVVENGRETAREMYRCRGFVVHHNTDIWADTYPQDLAPSASYWVMGGGWLATHIWNHYVYTLDKGFLKRYFYIINESVQFYLDFLVEENGVLIINPSVSPENTYLTQEGQAVSICSGCTMDTGILRDLFTQFLKCTEILDEGKELKQQVESTLERLIPYRTGKYGQLMEWNENYDEWELGHRHFSQLYPLFPSNQINEYDTPELVAAAGKSMERRMKHGGGHTGWSCAWAVNLYARLGDSKQAEQCIQRLLTEFTANNLFDLHPPLERIQGIPWVFQIDGNLGGSCGIAQLLLQSHLDEIFILPALPETWSDGSITGLCARNGFVVDLQWRDCELCKGILHSVAGQQAVIRSKQGLTIAANGEPVAIHIDEKGRYVFLTEKDRAYELIPQKIGDRN